MLASEVFLFERNYIMATTLLYLGIAVIVMGWLSLSFFAGKQLSAQKHYERQPQKLGEIKQSTVCLRWISRGIILIGLMLIIISILI